MWTLRERPIFIGRAIVKMHHRSSSDRAIFIWHGHDRHRTVATNRDYGALKEDTRTHLGSPRCGDGNRTVDTRWGWNGGSRLCDRDSQSRDRDSRSWGNPKSKWSRLDTWTHRTHLDKIERWGFDDRVDHGHDQCVIVAIDWPFTGSNIPHFSREFPFKNRCFSLFFLNSWLNHEGIKQFERKILSSSWSPTFRLDFDQNRSGIDHEFHRISSGFPLNAEPPRGRNQEKFASIWGNWIPIFVEIGLVVRFDQLSGGNLSFN